jgi:hypothetical protein
MPGKKVLPGISYALEYEVISGIGARLFSQLTAQHAAANQA